MDDINRQLTEARRAQAREASARREQEALERAEAPEEPPRALPAGSGRLTMERRQGEWRYYLCEHRVRVGAAIEFYVDPRIGWVRGTFQWGRRNTSPPTIRVPLGH